VNISQEGLQAINEAQANIDSLAIAITGVKSNTDVIADLSTQQSIAANEISSSSESVLELTTELAESAAQTMHFSDELKQRSQQQAKVIRQFR
jgi:methyl-accepting chemotaxis protein